MKGCNNMSHKSGFVTVIGRPNVGKSTLINALTEEKVAITSPKPQTTRANLKAIITEKDYQIIFIDTPGMHKPKSKLGEYMMQSAEQSLSAVDAILYMYDANDVTLNIADSNIIRFLEEVKNTPIFLIINKIDSAPKENILKIIEMLSEKIKFESIIPISALKSDGVKIIVKDIVNVLKEGPEYFPGNILTDTSVREICAEIIREKILNFTNEEVPHGTGVEIIIFKEPERNGGICQIEANIYCDKSSHKGILIGKEGSMLKRIGSSARRDMEKLTGFHINLKLWVKVKEDWKNDPNMLKDLGYKL